MRLFEAIKETITVGQAADYYGMKIGRNNMICCPFHNDHHPSMKLNPMYYYCFGCGATGDVIQAEEQKSGLITQMLLHGLMEAYGRKISKSRAWRICQPNRA